MSILQLVEILLQVLYFSLFWEARRAPDYSEKYSFQDQKLHRNVSFSVLSAFHENKYRYGQVLI